MASWLRRFVDMWCDLTHPLDYDRNPADAHAHNYCVRPHERPCNIVSSYKDI